MAFTSRMQRTAWHLNGGDKGFANGKTEFNLSRGVEGWGSFASTKIGTLDKRKINWGGRIGWEKEQEGGEKLDPN